MKYRLAGATYRVIAEKLTEERAQAYADAKGISIDRAMKKIQHVSTKTAWDDVTAEMEDLLRETELQRGDLMVLENARLDQLFSKALSLFVKGSVPAGRLASSRMARHLYNRLRRSGGCLRNRPRHRLSQGHAVPCQTVRH